MEKEIEGDQMASKEQETAERCLMYGWLQIKNVYCRPFLGLLILVFRGGGQAYRHACEKFSQIACLERKLG